MSAVYYNHGDLGLGRDMHCRSFVNPQGHTGQACYVSNYGHDANGNVAFGQDPDTSINQTIAKTNVIATVAMVYDPDNANNKVRFVVFDNLAQRTAFAALDNPGLAANGARNTPTHANIAVPDNCLTCHGIASQYTPVTSGTVAVKNARFLPFDPFNLRFSTVNAAYADSAVLPQIRQLNAHVMQTNTSAAISEFVTGMYAPDQVTDSWATAHTDWVAPGWTTNDVQTRVYNEVVKPYCRTCHMSQDAADTGAFTGFDWRTWDAFSQNSAAVTDRVCNARALNVPMPQSERTQTLLWQSPARAHLVNAFDVGGACAP